MAKLTFRITAAALFCFFQVASGQQKPSELVGLWRGTLLDIPIVLSISRSGEHYSGAINGKPLQKFRVNGDAFEFEFRANLDVWKGKTTFRGALNEDHSSITGTATGTPLGPIRLQRDETAKSGIDIRIPIQPTAFRGRGMTHLVYELHITNFGPGAVDVKQIEILGNLAKTAFAGGDLKRVLSQMHLNPDGTSIANMWITLPAGAAVPARLTHRLTFNNQVFDGPEVIVATQPLPVLSRPFRGSDWLANGGPENTSDHRRATMPNGLTAQRFAIDWFQFWPDGKEFHGPSKDNKSYAAYGTEVLAVADAVVATVQDNIPENTPGRNSRAVPITSETVGGNVVILDIGSSRYAVYAHLQPGSLRVKVGDRVQRGQVIALLGNSGNSTGPHLHFQVVDRNSLLDSEGVPYVIDSFEAFLPRSIREVRAKDKKYEKRENELPMGRELVRF